MIDVRTLHTFSDALRTHIAWERYQPQFEAWENALPEEFVMGNLSPDSSVQPLVFKRDHSVSGLYYADLRQWALQFDRR